MWYINNIHTTRTDSPTSVEWKYDQLLHI